MIDLTVAKLKAWRRIAGWTQADLARHAGVHVRSVKYHEQHKSVWKSRDDGTPRIGGWACSRFIEAFQAAGIPEPDLILIRGYQTSNLSKPVIATPTLCGARTRAGGSCMMRPELGKARCRLHGGASTGPRTAEGRQRIAQAQHERRVRENLKKPEACPTFRDQYAQAGAHVMGS